MSLDIIKSIRYNPFTNTFNPVYFVEIYRIEFIPEAGIYGVKLREAPLAGTTVSIVEISTSTIFQEVPFAIVPNTNQFRVDYFDPTGTSPDYKGTGYIEFNSADVNKVVQVSYYGIGSYGDNDINNLTDSFIRKDAPQSISNFERAQFLDNSRILELFVRYDNPQILTQEQRHQFRQNIGIAKYLYTNPVDPIDFYNSTGQEYFLQVGEVARISFTNLYNVPLRIQTLNNTYYEMTLIPYETGGTSGAYQLAIYLLPNNTTHSGQFYYSEVIRTASGLSSNYSQQSAFFIGLGFSSTQIHIINRTVYKNVKGMYDSYGFSNSYPYLGVFSSDWRNTTTQWTSLGTVIFPSSGSSGTILIRRLL